MTKAYLQTDVRKNIATGPLSIPADEGKTNESLVISCLVILSCPIASTKIRGESKCFSK